MDIRGLQRQRLVEHTIHWVEFLVRESVEIAMLEVPLSQPAFLDEPRSDGELDFS